MIQIDLPMPKSCNDDCPFNYDYCWCIAIDNEKWKKVKEDWNDNLLDRETRPEYCPLIEVEPVP